MPQEPTPAVAPVPPDVAQAITQAQMAAQDAARDAAIAATRAAMQATRSADAAAPVVVVTPPRTAREVEGLTVRRDMLRQQLERAEERRQELANDLQSVGDREGREDRPPNPVAEAAVRAGLEVRLRDADARVLQLERDIAATDRALTQAGPDVLAQYEQQRPREIVHQGVDEPEVVGLMGLAFVVGLLVMLLGGRLRHWRQRRRGGLGAPAGVGPDPRIDRLTQAVDAIAVEVERIGEGQRFVTQLMAERRELVAPGDVGRTLDVPGVR